MTIQDEPRFGYRALMLDVARFFIPKENVLRIIDCMAMLKINTLHFHLTDDNGWRLEIKKYPRLTETGAWRVNRMDVPFLFPAQSGTGRTYAYRRILYTGGCKGDGGLRCRTADRNYSRD